MDQKIIDEILEKYKKEVVHKHCPNKTDRVVKLSLNQHYITITQYLKSTDIDDIRELFYKIEIPSEINSSIQKSRHELMHIIESVCKNHGIIIQ